MRSQLLCIASRDSCVLGCACCTATRISACRVSLHIQQLSIQSITGPVLCLTGVCVSTETNELSTHLLQLSVHNNIIGPALCLAASTDSTQGALEPIFYEGFGDAPAVAVCCMQYSCILPQIGAQKHLHAAHLSRDCAMSIFLINLESLHRLLLCCCAENSHLVGNASCGQSHGSACMLAWHSIVVYLHVSGRHLLFKEGVACVLAPPMASTSLKKSEASLGSKLPTLLPSHRMHSTWPGCL